MGLIIACSMQEMSVLVNNRAVLRSIDENIKLRYSISAIRACGSVGRAPPWHGGGRGFKSHQVHQPSQQQLAGDAKAGVRRSPCPAEALVRRSRTTHLGEGGLCEGGQIKH